MKIVLISDLHIGYKQYNKKEREADIINAFQNVINQEQPSSDAMIIAGDLLHRKDITANQWLLLKDILSKYKHPIYAIEGNHDIVRGDNSWLKVLEVEGIIKMLDEPVLLSKDKIAIQGLNWIGKISLSDLPKPKPNYLNIFVCHGGIMGKVHEGMGEIDKSLLDEMNKRYDLIVTGHYHFSYNVGNLYNSGGLEVMSWSEVGKDKGYYVYDTDTKTTEFKPYASSRKFIRKEISLKDIESLGKFEGDILHIVVSDTADKLLEVNKNMLIEQILTITKALFVKIDIVNIGIDIKDIAGEINDVYTAVQSEVMDKVDISYFDRLIDDLSNDNSIDKNMREWYDRKNNN